MDKKCVDQREKNSWPLPVLFVLFCLLFVALIMKICLIVGPHVNTQLGQDYAPKLDQSTLEEIFHAWGNAHDIP